MNQMIQGRGGKRGGRRGGGGHNTEKGGRGESRG